MPLSFSMLFAFSKRRILMDSREFNSMLLNRFPNIKESFEKATSWQDGIDTGSTVVLEDVFMPYLLACFEK